MCEVAALFRCYQAGDRAARQHLITLHLATVQRIAYRYAHRGVALGDLIQEGMIGLMQAIDRFDVERRIAFRSFATLRIRGAMLTALKKQGAGNGNRSLDADQADDLPDEAPPIVEVLAARGVATDLVQALRCLDVRSRKVLEHRYGLLTGQPRTLQQVAATIGVSAEMVRRIEQAAIQQLRNSPIVQRAGNTEREEDMAIETTQRRTKLMATTIYRQTIEFLAANGPSGARIREIARAIGKGPANAREWMQHFERVGLVLVDHCKDGTRYRVNNG